MVLQNVPAASCHDLEGLRGDKNIERKLAPAARQHMRLRSLARDIGASLPVSSRPPGLEQIGDTRALWPHFTTLKICFLDGTEMARQQVLGIAQELIAYTNLR